MGVSQHLSSLSCELRIIRAKNIDHLIKSNGHLFVRCHLSSGNNKRIQLETQEISSKSDLFLNHSFSLDCFGTQDSMDKLMHRTIIFELRQRNHRPFIGRIGGSNLLAKVEIPWKTLSQSPEMETGKWVFMVAKSKGVSEDEKPPAVEVAMKVRVPAVAETAVARRRRQVREKKWDGCGCVDSGRCSCAEYEMFALAAALEGF